MLNNSEPVFSIEAFFSKIETNINSIENFFKPKFQENKIEENESTELELYYENSLYISSRDKIIEYCNDELNFYFKSLNFNILNGNYIQNDFSGIIDKYLQIIVSIKSLFADISKNTIKDNVFQKFIHELNHSENALNFLKKLCLNLFYNDNKIVYSIASNSSENFSSYVNIDKWDLNSIQILSYNIYLINADHYLSIDDDLLVKNIELIYSKSKSLILLSFSDYEYLKICELISLKSNFLKKKILLRKSEEIISNKNRLFIQSKNEYKEFSADDIVKSSNLSDFEKWINYAVNHYDLRNDSKDNIEEYANTIKLEIPIFPNTIKLLDLHLHIKYNKDIVSNESIDTALLNLNAIKKALLYKLNKTSRDSFEEYCLIINTTYCFNNIMSLLNDNNKGVELKSIYDEYLANEKLKNRKNYFATGTLLNYYSKELKSIFEKDDINSDIKKCDKILHLCIELIVKYEAEVEWFEKHSNYIYILPREEATLNIGSYKLYIYSSFVLPTSSNYLLTKFSSAINDLKFYQSNVKTVKSIKASLDKIEEFKGLFNKIEEKDTRTLELVALIGTVVSFIAGSMPGFKFINTAEEAIYFTLSLGSSLAVFAIVLYVFNRKVVPSKYLKIYLPIGFVLVILSWLILYYKSSKALEFKEEAPSKINIENTIDLKHQNNALNIDSLNIQN